MMYGKNYGKMSDEDKMYQASEDCATLIEANEIKMEKSRYKAAIAKAKEKMEALKYLDMDMGKMGKMPYKEYAKARKSQTKSAMIGQTDHYA